MTIFFENRYIKFMDTWHGNMLFYKNDTFIGKCLDNYGEWGRKEIEDTIEYCIGGAILDIGANIGTHSLSYSPYAKHIYSFEPQSLIYGLLCANIVLNSLDNISVAKCALGSHTGFSTINTLDIKHTGNFGRNELGNGIEPVAVRRLDEYNLDDISLIKIDVEGMEQSVLEGAIRTIRRCRPVIYIENDRLDKQSALCRTVSAMGYKWSWHTSPLYNENNYRNCKDNIFSEIAGINMLCIPKEKTT